MNEDEKIKMMAYLCSLTDEELQDLDQYTPEGHSGLYMFNVEDAPLTVAKLYRGMCDFDFINLCLETLQRLAKYPF